MCPEVCSGWTSQLLKKSWTTWGYTRPRVINCQWTGAGDSPLHCKTNCRYKYKSDTQLNNQFTATTGNLIFHSGTTKKNIPTRNPDPVDSPGGKRLQCQNLRMLVSVFPDCKRNVSKHLLSRHLRICRTWFISILWGSFLALFPTLPSVIFIGRGICPKPPGGRGMEKP